MSALRAQDLVLDEVDQDDLDEALKECLLDLGDALELRTVILPLLPLLIEGPGLHF